MNILECPHCNGKLYVYPIEPIEPMPSTRDRKIVRKFLQGERQASLSREFKLSAPRIDCILKSAFEKADSDLFERVGTQLTAYRTHAEYLLYKIFPEETSND